jgi:hypothetical protein
MYEAFSRVQQRKWGRIDNNNTYKIKAKIVTNVSTFVFVIIYCQQVLHNLFRTFLGHHQLSHKNTNHSSRIELS